MKKFKNHIAIPKIKVKGEFVEQLEEKEYISGMGKKVKDITKKLNDANIKWKPIVEHNIYREENSNVIFEGLKKTKVQTLLIPKNILRQIHKMNKTNKKEIIYTYARSCVIQPIMIGHTFGIHNGAKYIKAFIKPYHLGKTLGEFSPSKTLKPRSKFLRTKNNKLIILQRQKEENILALEEKKIKKNIVARRKHNL